MLAVHIFLVASILAPFVSSKNTLLSINGKTYLNGQYEVIARDNSNIKNNVVHGRIRGRNLKVVKCLTFEEKEALLHQLKISNDYLTLEVNDELLKLEDQEKILDDLYVKKYQEHFDNMKQNEDIYEEQDRILKQKNSEKGKKTNTMFDQD